MVKLQFNNFSPTIMYLVFVMLLQELVECLKPFATANEQIKVTAIERLQVRKNACRLSQQVW